MPLVEAYGWNEKLFPGDIVVMSHGQPPESSQLVAQASQSHMIRESAGVGPQSNDDQKSLSGT